MRKGSKCVYALVDQHTKNLVIFNIDNATFEIGKEGKGLMHIMDLTYNIDVQELLTLLQGCGVDLMHCQPNPEQQQPSPEMPQTVEAPVHAE